MELAIDWTSVLQEVFKVCLLPLLGVLTSCLITWILAKKKELQEKCENDLIDKYIGLLDATITSCVISTTQTYVESLKTQDKFDEEAQKIAFKQTFAAVMTILSDEAKEYLTEIYGDLTAYITNKIEESVYFSKSYK